MCHTPEIDIDQDETEPIETTFELNETLYSRANLPPTDEVNIWLGVCLFEDEMSAQSPEGNVTDSSSRQM